MKRGHVYTLVFMVVITVVLVFALAAAYEGFKPAIKASKDKRQQLAVLNVLGLDQGVTDDMVFDTYSANIQEAPLHGVSEVHGVPVLAYVKDGQPQAYAVPFEGSGLWGIIKGYLGVTADLSETTGIVFTSQNETPGLGGRIDEAEFKDKFRGLPLVSGQNLVYDSTREDAPDAVTGATQTSSAVLRMVNRTLNDYVFPGEVK